MRTVFHHTAASPPLPGFHPLARRLAALLRLGVQRFRQLRLPLARWSVYALLMLVIPASIGLSVVMERASSGIRNSIGPLLEQSGEGGRQAIHADSAAAEKNAMGITRLVHLFDLLALLSSGFLLYHVRARYRVEQQLAHQAGHDPLTGLAHRRSFETRLRGLPARPHAVVLGTIDRFTRIVGGLGHSFGDHMIVGLLGRMRQAAECSGGEVYRLDGANFAIL